LVGGPTSFVLRRSQKLAFRVSGFCVGNRTNDEGCDFNDRRPTTGDYNPSMLDEEAFHKHADASLESLKKSLIAAEDSAEIEVEDRAGALYVSFEDGARFVISPNAPVRQIWISALATSFKLDWSEDQQSFVLAKSGEQLKPLVARLINQQLGAERVSLT
jgi:frataxin